MNQRVHIMPIRFSVLIFIVGLLIVHAKEDDTKSELSITQEPLFKNMKAVEAKLADLWQIRFEN